MIVLWQLLLNIAPKGRPMAIEPPIFRSVTVRNFRGFRDEQTVELDGSAVLISGPNGTGKTSFFDAIQWLLTGSLPRLAALTSRRSDDHIVNRFRQGHLAYVAAEVLLRGELVRLVRNGKAKDAVLEWHGEDGHFSGEEAELRLTGAMLTHPGVTLEDALLTSGILQQDVVRLALQDDPKKRYRHMASLLGLQELTGFEEVVKQRAETMSRRASEAREQHATTESHSRSGEAELQRLQQRLGEQPELTVLRNQLAGRLTSQAPALLVSNLPHDLAGATTLGQSARQLRSRADQLLAEHEDLVLREVTVRRVDEAAVSGLTQDALRTRDLLQQAELTTRAASSRFADAQERSGQLVALAARALPLLGATCPVCEQGIDESDVAAHLREVIERGGEDLTGLERSLKEAQQTAQTLTEELQVLEAQLIELEAAQRHQRETTAARAAWLERCRRLAGETEVITAATTDRIGAGAVGALQSLRTSADEVAGAADELVSVLGAFTLAEQVERQRGVVEQNGARVSALREVAAASSHRAEDAKTLRNATTRATAAVTATRFAQLQPLVNDIFGRLDPHPVFTTMRFELDVSYRAGVADPVVEDDEGIRADPLLVFSSSQANVAALTYFLALSWTADKQALPFLLLDDPLQSMDDVNVLGFSDLCRHIRRRRQLIVSTHEQRLAGLLERKLAPRDENSRLRVIHFVGWDRSGPKIESHFVESHEDVSYMLSGT